VFSAEELRNNSAAVHRVAGIATAAGHKVILPVWHDVMKDDILSYSPTLADKVAATTKGKTIAQIAKALAEVLREE
jgi:DICT domain-containing protein